MTDCPVSEPEEFTVQPCPCEGPAVLTDIIDFHGAQRAQWSRLRVVCPVCPRSTGWHDTEAQAIREWDIMVAAT